MGKVRLYLIIVFSMISSALFAGDFSLGMNLGYRNSSTTYCKSIFGLKAGYNDLSFEMQIQGRDEVAFSLLYDLKTGRTLHNQFLLHSLYVPNEGGFTDFSYIFMQMLKAGCLKFSYCLGLQLGLAYSPYSVEYLWSLSPLVALDVALCYKAISLGFYLGLNNTIERSWKAVPIYQAYIDVEINESNSLEVSAFMREAEYLMDPWHMITAYGVSFAYLYRWET